ncbi:MAG: SWIM zinc finger domain-containing protein, partial [Nitrospinota bacterium]
MGGEVLPDLLNRRSLRRMAGPKSFERGEDYLTDGRVGPLAERGGTIEAEVRGSRPYHVELRAGEGDLDHSCTCPVGMDGAFCKHCVAVGLAWLGQGRTGQVPAGKPAEPRVTMDDVRAWLASRDKDTLVGMLMDRAMEDERLARRLLIKAAQEGTRGLDLAAYREAVDRAVRTGGFVEYSEAFGYVQGIGEAIDGIEELLKEGHASEAIGLAEYALERVEGAMGEVDESDGGMGDLLERLQEIH